MRTVQIKCNRERRLFDTIEGSKLKILIKCSNTKVCPYKSDCLRTTEIVLGAEKEAFDEFYKAINCPHCGKRLFDVTTDSVGIVTIKCENVRKSRNHSGCCRPGMNSLSDYGAPAQLLK